MRPNKNTLTPSLLEKFSGLIWSVKVHTSGLIAIESRNSQLKQVLFSSFEFTSGRTYFKEKLYDENWNLSLAFGGAQNLVLNSYEHEESPKSKGVLSVSVKDGSILWQQFNISLNSVHEGGLQVYDPKLLPRKYYWIDHLTAARVMAPIIDPESSVILPETDNSFVLPAFINHQALIGELSVLHYREKIIVSFHEVLNDRLAQRLIVYQEDMVLIDDILIAGIQKLQPEAFFMQQNHLFYIRNKEEILAFLL